MTLGFFACVVLAFIVIIAGGLILDQWQQARAWRRGKARPTFAKPARKTDQWNP